MSLIYFFNNIHDLLEIIKDSEGHKNQSESTFVMQTAFPHEVKIAEKVQGLNQIVKH